MTNRRDAGRRRHSFSFSRERLLGSSLISVFAALFLSPYVIFAQAPLINTPEGGWAVEKGTTKTITIYSGACYDVTNTTAFDHFVATSQASEWNSFLTKQLNNLIPTPVSCPASESVGYFVLSHLTSNGSLGGLSDANTKCFNDLTTHDWKGKSSAGNLDSTRIKAFLCDGTNCNNLTANTKYAFAKTNDTSVGGGVFTTDANGAGPGDSAAWNGSGTFGTTNLSIWTGRASNPAALDTLWHPTNSAGTNCKGWTNAGTSGGAADRLGFHGVNNSSTSTRWISGSTVNCAALYHYICYVAPAANPFDFEDQTDVAGFSAISSEIVQITGIKGASPVTISGTSGTPQFRICSDANCATVIADWRSITTNISPNQYLQLRMTSSPDPNVTHTATVSAGWRSDTWSISTSATLDNTPDGFAFPDTNNVSPSVVVNSAIVQVSGIESASLAITSSVGTPQYRTCMDANCSFTLINWTSAAGAILDGKYIQLRMTSAIGSLTTRVATIQIGTTSYNWNLTTKEIPYGYFVHARMGNYVGNLGGLEGANRACLEELTRWSWLGKDKAILDARHVFAFLCDETTCNNLMPNSIYAFASTLSSSGGALFTTNASGLGPGDSNSWNPSNYFGASVNYWTGRATGSSTLWPDSSNLSTCNGWTTSNSGSSGMYGIDSSTISGRWNYMTATCNNARSLVCFVNPEQNADTVDFEDQTGVPIATWVESNIVQITNISATMMVWNASSDTSVQFRVCSDSSCSTVLTDWSLSSVSVSNGNYVQVRVMSSGLANTTRSLTIKLGVNSDVWNVTTGTGSVDSSPDSFSIPTTDGADLNSLVSSDIVPITGITSADVTITGAGSPKVRLCADADCLSVIADWTTGPAAIQDGQYIQLQMTSAAAGWTTSTATVTVGTVSANWNVITGSTGFFVLTSITYTGNLGGLSGANSSCLTNLQANSWKNKAKATLSSATVRAFLCDGTTCNMPQPLSAYSFARSGDTTGGGAVFLTDSEGLGPGDTTAWSGVNYFNVTAEMHTGLDTGSPTKWIPQTASTCTNWTSSSGGANYGSSGLTSSTGIGRWANTLNGGCGSSAAKRLICIVDQDIIPNAFSFTNLTNQAQNALVNSNIVQITGFDSAVKVTLSTGNSSPQYRICSDSACNTVVTDWTTAQTVIQPNQYLQLLLTTPPAPGTTARATIAAGTVSTTWSVTTSGTTTYGYFVLTSGSWNGNLGGLSGADSKCLTDLTNNNWTGKASAGALTADRVKAWLCDGSTCTNTFTDTPYVTYKFARAADTTGGSGDFVTNANFQAPGDSADWSGLSHFNVSAEYWTGRSNGTDTLWASYTHPDSSCATWTSSSNGNYGRIGKSSATNRHRWEYPTPPGCGATKRLICLVQPIFDLTPDAFSFTDLTNQSKSTWVTSNIVQITGIDRQARIKISGMGTPEYRICPDSSCTGVTTWTAADGWINSGQYVQLRLRTSSLDGMGNLAVLSVGTARADWTVTTAGTPPQQAYFVLTSTAWNGSLGGVAGANSKCLTDLTNNDWKGKASAGAINNRRVSAFICDFANSTCNQPLPSTVYNFARSGSPTSGGAFFATSSTGYGPDDRQAWDTPPYFDIDGLYWTGMATWPSSSPNYDKFFNYTADSDDCSGWTSSGSNWNSRGQSGSLSSTGAGRWGSWRYCNSSHRLVCLVGPSQTPDAINFTPLTGQATNTLVTSDIVQLTGIEVTSSVPISLIASGANGLAQYRVCNDSTCSSAFGWTTTASTVTNGKYVQLQLTTSFAAGTTFSAQLRVGTAPGLTTQWNVTTSGVAPAPGYFVLTNTSFNGNLGGLAGANSICLTELETYDWKGKSSAGTLDSTRVKAFLCTSSGCNNLLPNSNYYFAVAGSTGAGGAMFSTNSSGLGPNNAAPWGQSDHFNAAAGTVWWTGRAAGTDSATWPASNSGSHCSNFTSSLSTTSGMRGVPYSTSSRWGFVGSTCDNNFRFICFVNPP
jgi:hypothetical protein